jgi:hypothetical protein
MAAQLQPVMCHRQSSSSLEVVPRWVKVVAAIVQLFKQVCSSYTYAWCL